MDVFNVVLTNPAVVVALAVVLLATLYMFTTLLLGGGTVKNYQDKYVFITGCDTGFGKMTALRLDQLGFHVIAACFTSEGQKTLQEKASDRLTSFRMDVTKSDQIQEVYRQVQALIPSDKGLWGVVNNAGIAILGPVDWLPLDTFKRSADVNLWGLIDVSKTFLPLIKKTKGRIVNVVSIAGRACLPHAAPYCVSKFGAEAFSDALRREMKPFGVQVSIVEPGFFHTEMTSKKHLEKSWMNLWNSLDKDTKQEYGEECNKNYVHNLLAGMVDTCCSYSTYKVIDAITHAVTSSRPKARYVIGWDARLLWIWVSRLPTSVGDALLELLAKRRAVPRSLEQR